MSEKEKLRWVVWFRPGINGWVSILARRPVGREKAHGHGENILYLGWNGERFARGKQHDAFLLLPQGEQNEIETQIAEAKDAGWLP